MDLQKQLSGANIPIPIIFITAHGDIPMSVRAMKGGAVEFLTKPLGEQDLLDAIKSPWIEIVPAGRRKEKRQN